MSGSGVLVSMSVNNTSPSDAEIAAAAAAGARCVRFDASAGNIAQRVRAHAAHGMKSLPILRGADTSAAGIVKGNANVVALEYWNEPYYGTSGPKMTGAQYGSDYAQGAPKLRAACPGVPIICNVRTSKDLPTWTDDMLAAIGSAQIDAICTHPYDGDPALGLKPGSEWVDTSGYPWAFRRLCVEHDNVASKIGRKAPIWITEVGWAAAPNVPNNGGGTPGNRQTAERITQLFAAVKALLAQGYEIACVSLYALITWNPAGAESFGIVNGSLTPIQPQYDAFRAGVGTL